MAMTSRPQRAGAPSINLLFHSGRRLSGSRILMVGAYRPSEMSLGAGVVKALDQRLPAIHREGPVLGGCHHRTAL